MNCGPSHVWTSSGTSTPVTGDPCDCGMARWSGDTPCHCPFCPGLQAEVTRLTALLLAQAEEPPYLAEANHDCHGDDGDGRCDCPKCAGTCRCADVEAAHAVPDDGADADKAYDDYQHEQEQNHD